MGPSESKACTIKLPEKNNAHADTIGEIWGQGQPETLLCNAYIDVYTNTH